MENSEVRQQPTGAAPEAQQRESEKKPDIFLSAYQHILEEIKAGNVDTASITSELKTLDLDALSEVRHRAEQDAAALGAWTEKVMAMLEAAKDKPDALKKLQKQYEDFSIEVEHRKQAAHLLTEAVSNIEKEFEAKRAEQIPTNFFKEKTVVEKTAPAPIDFGMKAQESDKATDVKTLEILPTTPHRKETIKKYWMDAHAKLISTLTAEMEGQLKAGAKGEALGIAARGQRKLEASVNDIKALGIGDILSTPEIRSAQNRFDEISQNAKAPSIDKEMSREAILARIDEAERLFKASEPANNEITDTPPASTVKGGTQVERPALVVPMLEETTAAARPLHAKLDKVFEETTRTDKRTSETNDRRHAYDEALNAIQLAEASGDEQAAKDAMEKLTLILEHRNAKEAAAQQPVEKFVVPTETQEQLREARKQEDIVREKYRAALKVVDNALTVIEQDGNDLGIEFDRTSTEHKLKENPSKKALAEVSLASEKAAAFDNIEMIVAAVDSKRTELAAMKTRFKPTTEESIIAGIAEAMKIRYQAEELNNVMHESLSADDLETIQAVAGNDGVKKTQELYVDRRRAAYSKLKELSKFLHDRALSTESRHEETVFDLPEKQKEKVTKTSAEEMENAFYDLGDAGFVGDTEPNITVNPRIPRNENAWNEKTEKIQRIVLEKIPSEKETAAAIAKLENGTESEKKEGRAILLALSRSAGKLKGYAKRYLSPIIEALSSDGEGKK